MSKYDFGGLEKHPANILRLISELEGSYQLCKYMGFEEDMKILDEMKKPYYKLYFKTKKEYDAKWKCGRQNALGVVKWLPQINVLRLDAMFHLRKDTKIRYVNPAG